MITVALSPSMRHDFTDMVRPFFSTTMSAKAARGNNKQQITKNKQTPHVRASPLLFGIRSLLLLIE
jgi:hypothetical protein